MSEPCQCGIRERANINWMFTFLLGLQYCCCTFILKYKLFKKANLAFKKIYILKRGNI
jgi:hypothetical protein